MVILSDGSAIKKSLIDSLIIEPRGYSIATATHSDYFYLHINYNNHSHSEFFHKYEEAVAERNRIIGAIENE